MKSNEGVGLLEIVLAVAIFGVIASAVASLAATGLDVSVIAAPLVEAEGYVTEAMTAVRTIQDRAWNEFTLINSGFTLAGDTWNFLGESTTEVLGAFSRRVLFADVCRDGAHNIIACPGAYTDPHSKSVTAEVTWGVGASERIVSATTLLTNWASSFWTQTNWIGGSGQTIWSDSTKYESDDGNIDIGTVGSVKLASGGMTCGLYEWPFTNASDYLFDPADIQVNGGYAELVSVTIPPASGGTTNADFATAAPPWTYADWNDTATYVNGAYTATGGNPTGNVSVTIAERKSSILSGYWEQSFTTTVSNPTASLNFDWAVSQIDTTYMTSFQLYAFVDAAPGAPTIDTEVWSSGNRTAVSGWASAPAINIAPKVTVPGTYYVKLAAHIQTKGGGGAVNGQSVARFDNAQLDWSSPGGSGYPTTNPTIAPVSAYSPTSMSEWGAFQEDAVKNGGEIYYQLSDDGGATWKYWNSLSWVTAVTLTSFNTASVVNANITSFPVTASNIMFRAFFSSDGSQLVRLNAVRIECRRAYQWPFTNASDYLFDPADIQVNGGYAELVSVTIPPASGGTTNADFATAAPPWTYADWNDTATYVNGAYTATGGNPTGNVSVTIAERKSSILSGYWEQSFTTTVSNPTASLNFDWAVSQIDTTYMTSFQLYAFVDAAPGAPTIDTEVWSSGNRTAVSGWASAPAINIAPKVTVPGTYYVKLAAHIQTKGGGGAVNGQSVARFDNAQLDWSSPGGSGYPTTNPTIAPVMSLNVGNVDAWTSFNAMEIVNGGSVYYQLSDDGGATWQYWNGGAWTTVTAPIHFNTAGVVNANIQTVDPSSGQIAFRAFLSSNGAQQIQIDEITITYREVISSGAYAVYGELISSAFDMTDASAVEIIEWDEDVSTCPAMCDIKFQVHTAPDNGGMPGLWGAWYGVTGAGTYFNLPTGAMVPTALNGNQWVQYRAELTGDGSATPILQEVRINYQ